MTKTLEAVYENGVFKPLTTPSGIGEHRRVTLTVTDAEGLGSLAECSGRISGADAQEMRDIVHREFERVDAGEWK
jgi:predicted DNA-binding antitoxin AbrB/MazE fold protein